MEKICIKCKLSKPREDFNRHAGTRDGLRTDCRVCSRLQGQLHRLNHREKVLAAHKKHYHTIDWEHRLEKQYGLPLGAYNKILEAQNHCCAICKRTSKHRLNVDHCHVTGKIRGLLCRQCNVLLGMARDLPELLECAIVYLKV